MASADSKLRMHPVRRLLQKSLKLPKALGQYSSTQGDATYQRSAGEALVIPDYFNGGLPTELLILIGTYVERKQDLARLCMASKGFRLIYAPFLFRVLEIKGPNSMVMRLAAALPTSGLSQLVTELYVHLERDRTCAKRIEGRKSGMKPEFLRRGCQCGKPAEALARLLASLHNIKTLEIQCNLCTQSHSHDPIHHLEMPRLTSFTFHCRSIDSPKPLASILLAPCMNRVEVLNVACNYERWYSSPSADATRLGDAVPNLHTLFHCGGWVHTRLLVTRRVERLHFDEYRCQGYRYGASRGREMQYLHENICVSPGVLSHLSRYDILEWLAPVMEQKIEPYRHLKFIGTIYLERGETEALATLRILAPLKALKSIALYQTLTCSSECIQLVFSHEFFVLLGQDLPSLRRVFLHSREPTLWENQGTWERRSIPQFEPWDLVSGKIDAF